MAKIGEGDERWIVKEREDGANCNNWHWTTKDSSSNVRQALSEAVKGATFPPDGALAGCRIKSAEATGDASVNNRKGRTFLIYEIKLKCKWEAEVRDADGHLVESCKGKVTFPDISAESLDDLDVEFESNARGAPLSEAMRKQGVVRLKAVVQQTIGELQAEVAANANLPKPASLATPAVKQPLPQPISVGPATAPATGSVAAPRKPASAAAIIDSSDEEGGGDDDDEKPPAAMAEALRKLRADPAGTKVLRLSNLGVCDVHLKGLFEALQHSQLSLEELDLGFNRITDQGVHTIVKALAGGAVLELGRLYLGGNRVSAAGMALSQHMKQGRSDLEVNWKEQLRNAKSICSVGSVYAQSPAQKAGLQTGDSIVAFGHIQAAEYKGVSESIVPLVKKSVAKPIDVVVVRLEGEVKHVKLTLTPRSWSGAGLLGCVLK